MRGWFAIGVWHGKNEDNIGTLVRSARAFGAAFVFTVGQRYERQASAVKADRHIPVLRFPDLAELRLALPKSCRIVGVELDERATPLARFRHPLAACYLLGGEDHGLGAEVRRGIQLVQIEGAGYCLNVATAGSIVLWDRVANKHAAKLSDPAAQRAATPPVPRA